MDQRTALRRRSEQGVMEPDVLRVLETVKHSKGERIDGKLQFRNLSSISYAIDKYLLTSLRCSEFGPRSHHHFVTAAGVNFLKEHRRTFVTPREPTHRNVYFISRTGNQFSTTKISDLDSLLRNLDLTEVLQEHMEETLLRGLPFAFDGSLYVMDETYFYSHSM